jgi:hypothetical protein
MAKTTFRDGRTYDLVCKSLDGDYTIAESRVDYASYAAGALPATTGTMTVGMNSYDVHTITPTAACTLNASGGLPGQRSTIVVTTSGAESFDITFNTGFKSAGALSTGTDTAKVFCVTFACPSAGTWVETGRTAAM